MGDTGIEPVTSSVSGKRAPAAPIAHASLSSRSGLTAKLPFHRADDGTRTRDPHLGKVMLYQLSHIREDAVHYTSQMLSPGSSGARLLGSAETAQPVTLRVNKFLALAHRVLVGDTGIEPVTSSVSGKRAPAAPIAHARWVRDSNPCTRLCRPLPRLSANPPCGSTVKTVFPSSG